MSNITEQILNAIDLIAEDKVSKLHFDKTVQAKIYSIVDSDTGEYKVRYNGNIFSAFAEDPSQTYKIDDLVYVKVPEGDFSNKKIITSLVTAQSLSEQQKNQLQNQVASVSPSLTDMYPGLAQPPYGVIAGITPGKPGSEFYIYKGSDTYNPSDYHGLFQQYASQYENIRISGSFLTQFHCVHTQGNYGLEVGFYGANNKTVSFRLDLNNFNGSPYSFSVASPQSVVIKFAKKSLLGLKYIKLFEENFIPDKFIENGVITDKENLTDPNIFASDIIIDFVEVLDLSNVAYYLDIVALQGIAFSAGISTIVLQGRLLHQGNNITNDDKCTYEWFKRDPSVMIGDSRYNNSAGFGWAPLGQKESSLTLTAADVEYQQEYKLLVLYNNTINLSAQITIFNNNNASKYQNNFSLAQRTDYGTLSLYITDQNLIGDWYIGYLDGGYEMIKNGSNVNSVVVNDYLQYDSVTFYCGVKTRAGVALGVLEYQIVDSTSQDDVIIAFVGEDIFRYDANGDTPIENAEKDRTLQVNLTWKEGIGTSYSVSWVMRRPDGTETAIPNNRTSAFNPADSMLQTLWVDNYNILHYNIKQKYKVNYNNNTVTVKIHTLSGKDYLYDKEILFLKDGDQGTNGTTYIASIRPCDGNGTKLSGLHPLVYNNGWGAALPLRCYVYKDGELINLDTGNYTLAFKWTGTNVSIAGSTDRISVNGTTTVSTAAASAQLEFFVKAQVTITDRQHSNKTIVIYTSYPIDVAVAGFDYIRANIEDIPSYIKYNSSGQNPSYYSNDINYYYNSIPYNNLITSVNTKILTIRTASDNKKYLNPTAEFLYENIKSNSESNIAILRMADPTNGARYLLHPIVMYLDTYGNEQINGWDGTALSIDEVNGQYIFAPTFGAGTKDSANRFTGVVMGRDTTQNQIGIYGYQSGVSTYGLMADGSAYFGASGRGGRIYINGNSGTISGGGGGDSISGMTITLANLGTAGTTNAIKLGAGAFSVSYDGSMTATKATITGKITATSGTIGGWNIGTTDLNSTQNGSRKVGLDSSKDNWWAIWAGQTIAGSGYDPAWAEPKISSPAPFVVTKDGYVYARNAYISGNINATTGSIGGWTIAQNKLYSGKVGMASSGTAAFWVGNGFNENSNGPGNPNWTSDSTYFLVTRAGKLYCKDATVNGNIQAKSGTIGCKEDGTGGWVIGINSISNETASNFIKITTTGIYAGDIDYRGTRTTNFSVSSTGKLSAKDADIEGTLRVGSLYMKNNDKYTSALAMDESGRYAQIQGEYLNVKQINVNNGKFIVTSDGDVTMKGSITLSGALSFNSDYIGRIQYSSNKSSWHSDRRSTDKYGRTCNGFDRYGNPTYSDAYSLSEEVTKSSIIAALDNTKTLDNTFITSDGVSTPSIWSAKIYSPIIYANEFWAMPYDTGESGHFILGTNNQTKRYLDIFYEERQSTKQVYFLGEGYTTATRDLATLHFDNFAAIFMTPQQLCLNAWGGIGGGPSISIAYPSISQGQSSIFDIYAHTTSVQVDIGAKNSTYTPQQSTVTLINCDLVGSKKQDNNNLYSRIQNFTLQNCTIASSCTINASVTAKFG